MRSDCDLRGRAGKQMTVSSVLPIPCTPRAPHNINDHNGNIKDHKTEQENSPSPEEEEEEEEKSLNKKKTAERRKAEVWSTLVRCLHPCS